TIEARNWVTFVRSVCIHAGAIVSAALAWEISQLRHTSATTSASPRAAVRQAAAAIKANNRREPACSDRTVGRACGRARAPGVRAVAATNFRLVAQLDWIQSVWRRLYPLLEDACSTLCSSVEDSSWGPQSVCSHFSS